jgi:hypothetical protein
MEEGYLPDRGEGYTYLTSWYPGKPKMGFLGIKGIVWGTLKGIPVTMYRCPECGCLKSYAKSL